MPPLVVVGLLAQFWLRPFFEAVALDAGLTVGIFATLANLGRRYVATVLAVYFVVLVAAKTGEAYLSPTPLARAEVKVRSGETVRGALVVTDGGSWYVSTSRGRFRMIPANEILSATVRSVKHEPRPVLKVAWDRVRHWF